MKLTFAAPYQSITTFPDTEINDFAVITGLNGSGKTHLLNAISTGQIQVEGIDPSEIVFYNYNEFTIHNSDPGNDPQLQQKQNSFATKSGQLSQRLNAERNSVLSSFQPVFSYDGLQFSEHSFLQIPDFENATNWSDADFEQYERLVEKYGYSFPMEFSQEINGHQRLLFDHIGYFRISDIRDFIKFIKRVKIMGEALQMIRSSGYNPEITEWETPELSRFMEGYQSSDNKIEYFHQMQMEDPARHSNGFNLFLGHAYGIPEYFNNLRPDRCLDLRDVMVALFRDITKHFEFKMPPESLQLFKAINGANLLKPIASESGFLNLHDIKIAEKQYQIQQRQNEYAEFESYKGKPTHYLSEEEFVRTHGLSPVDTLNKVLNEYDCNGYEFRQNEIYYSWGVDVNNQHVDITIYNKAGNYATTLDALSSGERTLLALAFTIHKLKKRRVIAKLFLMDEIDSALHPSMSKRLLKVLHKLFYEEMGINLIISTHSPSTVAFAPANSNYIMRRDGNPKLISVSKDAALSELTAGVPSFSVNYENRRQIFVESKYDADYYEALYQLLREDLDHEVSLNFISSGDSEINGNGIGMANCDQVVKITKLLREAGNRFIWGIIDWDLKNTESQEGVKVLGLGSRYSIENYLLDPLLVGMLLWRETHCDAAFFRMSAGRKYHEVINFESTDLQKIIDAVVAQLELLVKPQDTTMVTYKTIGLMELSLPKWFTEYQGHKLEDDYLRAFPKLNEIKKGKEWLLKGTVISKVIADFSRLAPMDLLNILKAVQEV